MCFSGSSKKTRLVSHINPDVLWRSAKPGWDLQIVENHWSFQALSLWALLQTGLAMGRMSLVYIYIYIIDTQQKKHDGLEQNQVILFNDVRYSFLQKPSRPVFPLVVWFSDVFWSGFPALAGDGSKKAHQKRREHMAKTCHFDNQFRLLKWMAYTWWLFVPALSAKQREKIWVHPIETVVGWFQK